MPAQNNQDIQEAVVTVYQLTQKEKNRKQRETQEDYYRRRNDVKRYIQKQDNTLRQHAGQIQLLTATINDLQKRLQNSRSNEFCQYSLQEFYRKWIEGDVSRSGFTLFTILNHRFLDSSEHSIRTSGKLLQPCGSSPLSLLLTVENEVIS